MLNLELIYNCTSFKQIAQKKNVKFIWPAICEQTVKSIKNEITSEKVLRHLNLKLPFLVTTNSSPYGISVNL